VRESPARDATLPSTSPTSRDLVDLAAYPALVWHRGEESRAPTCRRPYLLASWLTLAPKRPVGARTRRCLGRPRENLGSLSLPLSPSSSVCGEWRPKSAWPPQRGAQSAVSRSPVGPAPLLTPPAGDYPPPSPWSPGLGASATREEAAGAACPATEASPGESDTASARPRLAGAEEGDAQSTGRGARPGPGFLLPSGGAGPKPLESRLPAGLGCTRKLPRISRQPNYTGTECPEQTLEGGQDTQLA
jgi:hypothetical protein